jgi:hypothetical protein
MASNFHSDLPNDQIHNPKDFSECPNSSVLTKDNSGVLDWNTSPYGTETTITCGEDVAGGLHNKNFFVFLDETNKAECHFNVTGETAVFVPTPGYFQIEIDITSNDTAIAVAAEIKAEFDRQGGAWSALTTTVSGTGKVTFSGMTNADDTLDGNTNFGFSNVKTYTGTTVLTSTAGVLEWLPGGGGSGTVTDVTGTAPVVSSGGTTPDISMAAAGSSTDGYLTASDWNMFNAKINTHTQSLGGWASTGVYNDYYVQNKEINNDLQFITRVGTNLATSITFLQVLQAAFHTGISGESLLRFRGVISGNNPVQVELNLCSARIDCVNNALLSVNIHASQGFNLNGNDRPHCISLTPSSPPTLADEELVFIAIRYTDDRDISRFRFTGRVEIKKT